jgi:hypothetical protein
MTPSHSHCRIKWRTLVALFGVVERDASAGSVLSRPVSWENRGAPQIIRRNYANYLGAVTPERGLADANYTAPCGQYSFTDCEDAGTHS